MPKKSTAVTSIVTLLQVQAEVGASEDTDVDYDTPGGQDYDDPVQSYSP